jgi:hypothetical protein
MLSIWTESKDFRRKPFAHCIEENVSMSYVVTQLQDSGYDWSFNFLCISNQWNWPCDGVSYDNWTNDLWYDILRGMFKELHNPLIQILPPLYAFINPLLTSIVEIAVNRRWERCVLLGSGEILIEKLELSNCIPYPTGRASADMNWLSVVHFSHVQQVQVRVKEICKCQLVKETNSGYIMWTILLQHDTILECEVLRTAIQCGQ